MPSGVVTVAVTTGVPDGRTSELARAFVSSGSSFTIREKASKRMLFLASSLRSP